MRLAVLLLTLFVCLAPAQQGDNIWRGDLVDWQCKQEDPSRPCPVNRRTSQFALSADGGVLLKLDSKGNELAAEELARTGASGTVAVTIETFEEGAIDRELRVKSVQTTQTVTR